MTTAFSQWSDVADAFTRHIAHYATTGGGENALVGLKTEGSISLQYAGRVVYELFQNALDRAEHQVVVSFSDGVLAVANDGRAVSVSPPMRYDQQLPQGRSDFHALCTLHISNKTPEHDFGNKGIGFRSVFGVSDRCEVWSRLADVGWWGIELTARCIPSQWEACAIPALDTLVRSLGAEPRPSFHLPRPLRQRHAPHPIAEGLHTVVLLRVAEGRHRIQIAEEVARLEATRFQFVGLRVPDLSLLVQDQPLHSEAGWPVVWSAEVPDLAECAAAAGHVVSAPRVAVAWAPPNTDESGWLYNYLPTKMETGLPLDLHGDFQVKADREGMALDVGNVVGSYNHALLEHAARGHVNALTSAASHPECRTDLWTLVAYPEGAPAAWTTALNRALFPSDSFEQWIDLAVDFFARPKPELAYRHFWDASLRWIERLVGCGYWTKTWQRRAKAFCDALAERKVAIIPIRTDNGDAAVALPSRQSRGDRAQRRVFFWSSVDETSAPRVPAPLLRAGRSVTDFDLGAFTKPAGVVRYEPSQVLQDLRQLPNDTATRQTAPALLDSEQAALLRLAWVLSPAEVPSHFAWRAFTENELTRQMGRALATLHLPTVAGQWEPARQLSRDRIDTEKLAMLLSVEACAFADFARWLGVAPAGAIPLVERGQVGWVQALNEPPPLQPPGRGMVGKLSPLLERVEALDSVVDALDGLLPDNKWSDVYATVATTPWIDARYFRTPDGLSPLPAPIAPQDVSLAYRDTRSVFFAVPRNLEELEQFRRLGALSGPESEAAFLSAPRILAWLKRRCPKPEVLSASLSTRLAALFDLLTTKMDLEAVPGIPLLVEQRGTVRWRRDSDAVFVAHREERQELRRFFPSVALAAATYRKGLPDALAIREIRLRKHVCGDGQMVVTPLARQLVTQMSLALPVLCAAAEQSRLVRVDVDRVRRAWLSPLLQSDDAWMAIHVDGPDLPPKEWRRHAHEDVFYIPGDTKEASGVILFDTRRPDGPPLRHFGTALARMLVRNIALGPLFAEILAGLTEDALEDYVERRHLADLRDEWAQKLSPLTADQLARLTAHVGGFAADPEAVIRTGRIGRDDLRSDAPDSHAALESALYRDVEGALVTHLPQVVVAVDNELRWQSWFVRHKGQLEAWLSHVTELGPKWIGSLHRHIIPALDSVRFDSAAACTEWVSSQGLVIGSISEALEQFAATFAPVTEKPRLASHSTWAPGVGRHAAARGGPEGKLDPSKMLDESLARSAWGDAAERALLAYVIDTTQGFLEGPRHAEAKAALLSVFRPGTRTRARVALALDKRNWSAALHVAQLWSGAGYDVLGLEEVTGALKPVRYECKGLPTSAPKIRVFLSRRELAVARETHASGPGRWCLVGVEPTGASVDLTEWVQPVIEADETPLTPLHALGLEPDGLRLIIVRG